MLEVDIGSDELEQYLKVLGSKRQRAVITVLADCDEVLDLDMLAEYVAEEVFDAPLDALGGHEVRRVKIRLHHNDLPRLDSGGLVEYDYRSQIIVPGEDIEQVSRVLQNFR